MAPKSFALGLLWLVEILWESTVLAGNFKLSSSKSITWSLNEDSGISVQLQQLVQVAPLVSVVE